MTGGRIAYFLNTNAEAIFLRSGVVVDPNAPVHPCFLYESLWCLAGFLLIHFIFSKLRTFDGELIFIYAAWYGFGRAAIETFRTDSLMIGSIRVSQLVGIITAVIAVVLIVVLSVRAKKQNIPLYKDTEAAHAVVSACEERDRIAREKRAEKKATREKATELEEHEKLIIDDEEGTESEGDENHVS
jgi:phosphatidylglycerol:prolipoprotein diacylglycerol transferase